MCASEAARSASAMPGTSRSTAAFVASGVTSSGRQARPARRQDERVAGVGEVVQAVLDEAEVVRHDLHRVDVGAGLLGQAGQQRAALVLALAAADGRRDREDGGAHRGAA